MEYSELVATIKPFMKVKSKKQSVPKIIITHYTKHFEQTFSS